MSITVEINSTDRSDHIDWRTLSVEQVITNQVDSARFTIRKYGSRTYTPTVGDDVEIYDGADKIFGGEIINFNERVESGAAGIVYDINCVDWTFLFDSQLVSRSYENETIADIIDDIVTDFTDGSFTTTGVTSTFVIEKIVFNQIKPSECLRQLAKIVNYNWYIDPDKDIQFFAKFANSAPFNLTDTSGNYIFEKLQRKVDGTQLANTVVVRGGEYDGDEYNNSITVNGNSTRSFELPYKFSNLVVKLDDGSVTDTMEAGTTTTTVKATLHGLSAGDVITNQTRSNAVRVVLTTPDANTFTVAAVTGQTNGDTFSIFQDQQVGIDFIDAFGASVDVLFNFAEKTIRWNAPLSDSDIIYYAGNPKVPVLATAQDPVSVAQFGEKSKLIRDDTIEDLDTARKRATAEVNVYAEEIEDGKFETYTSGLRSGMTINLTSTRRGNNTDFLIRKIQAIPTDPNNFEYKVDLITTAKYELVELLRSLLNPDSKQADDSEVAEIIKMDTQIVTIAETITAVTAVTDTATVTISESISKDPLGASTEPTWVWAKYVPSPWPTDTKRQGHYDRGAKYSA